MHRRVRFLVLTFIGVITFAFSAATFPNLFSNLTAQQKQEKPFPRRELIPIPMAPDEVNLEKRIRRESKNRLFDSPRGEDLTKQGKGEIYGRVSETPPPTTFPVRESDLIVVGKIVKAQPYLSESKTSIYSEFKIEIQEYLYRKEENRKVQASNFITGIREGGAILMPSGQVIQYVVSGIGYLPEENSRYVLFLKLTDDGSDYRILSGYELAASGIYPLEDYDDRKALYGLAEMQLITEIRNRIVNR